MAELAHPTSVEEVDHLVLQLPARTTNALAEASGPVRGRDECPVCKVLVKEVGQGGLPGDAARCLLDWHAPWEQRLHEARAWVLCALAGYVSDPDPGPKRGKK